MQIGVIQIRVMQIVVNIRQNWVRHIMEHIIKHIMEQLLKQPMVIKHIRPIRLVIRRIRLVLIRHIRLVIEQPMKQQVIIQPIRQLVVRRLIRQLIIRVGGQLISQLDNIRLFLNICQLERILKFWKKLFKKKIFTCEFFLKDLWYIFCLIFNSIIICHLSLSWYILNDFLFLIFNNRLLIWDILYSGFTFDCLMRKKKIQKKKYLCLCNNWLGNYRLSNNLLDYWLLNILLDGDLLYNWLLVVLGLNIWCPDWGCLNWISILRILLFLLII